MVYKALGVIWYGFQAISLVGSALYMTLVMAVTNVVTSVTATPTPEPSPSVPFARDVMDSAGWLSRQQISVWFALVTILFGAVIFAVIRYLLTGQTEQRIAHQQEIKEMRTQFAALQIEEKGLSMQLLQYLEKDHSQTIVLVRDNQSIMQENINLLKTIQQDRHDERIVREENNKILKKISTQQNTEASAHAR